MQHDSGNPYSLSQNYLTNLAITDDKQLIVATLRGINIYNPMTDNFERIACDLPNGGTNLLNSNFINCILTDGEHIWFGTETGGINLLNPRQLSIRQLTGMTRKIRQVYPIILSMQFMKMYTEPYG